MKEGIIMSATVKLGVVIGLILLIIILGIIREFLRHKEFIDNEEYR